MMDDYCVECWTEADELVPGEACACGLVYCGGCYPDHSRECEEAS